MTDCEHPEDALGPLPYRGQVDIDEWECAECGTWQIRNLGIDKAAESDYGVFVNGISIGALGGLIGHPSLFMHGDQPRSTDVERAFGLMSEYSVEMTMDLSKLRESMKMLRKTMAKPLISISTAELMMTGDLVDGL